MNRSALSNWSRALRGNALTAAHSRLTAYAAWKKTDANLAARAWREFGVQDHHGAGDKLFAGFLKRMGQVAAQEKDITGFECADIVTDKGSAFAFGK